MSKTKIFALAVCGALVFALAGMTGCSCSSSTPDNSSNSNTTNTSSASTNIDKSDDKQASYFVGKWELSEPNEETQQKINDAADQDNVEFCCTFNADGTGEINKNKQITPFAWKASDNDAVTLTSFAGAQTITRIPVTDGKITIDGDTYSKTQ